MPSLRDTACKKFAVGEMILKVTQGHLQWHCLIGHIIWFSVVTVFQCCRILWGCTATFWMRVTTCDLTVNNPCLVIVTDIYDFLFTVKHILANIIVSCVRCHIWKFLE